MPRRGSQLGLARRLPARWRGLRTCREPPGATSYRASDGEIAWERAGGGSSVSSSVVLGERLLLPFDGLLCVSPSGDEAEEVWNNRRARPSNTSPVIWGERAYLLSGQGVLAASTSRMVKSLGRLAWEVATGRLP
ncbi:MAG: hypothetical protein R3B96_21460 [Pirellulaceae bacterium]